jgi:hypothetical protein
MLRALKPQDTMELALVDRIVSATWRLNRAQFNEHLLFTDRESEVREGIETEARKLQRDFHFPDAVSAARPPLGRVREFTRYCTLMDLLEGESVAAGMLAVAVRAKDQAFERLGRYEQRLELTLHRCLRDLHALRAKAAAYKDLPESPFLAQEVIGAATDGPPAPSAPPPRPPGRTEGRAAPREHEEPFDGRPIIEAQAEPFPPRPPATPPATPPAAPPAQNEPTVGFFAASPAGAEGCDDAPGQTAHADRSPATPGASAAAADDAPRADPDPGPRANA